MRFGQGLFVIECVETQSAGGWRFATLDYLVGDVRLGPARDCALNAALPAFERIARNAGRRRAAELFSMDGEVAFSKIWTELYSSDATDPDAWELYGPLVALPAIDGFDPWKAFLLETNTDARLLWRQLHSTSSKVREARFLAGEFDAVIADAIEWLRRCLASET